MSQPTQCYNVDNKKCILVEFTNEQNKIQIGYLSWIPKEHIPKLSAIIANEEELSVYWPDVDIAEANVMKSKLKNASFTKCPVKILASGEWTELREKQRNFENFRLAGTTKSTRSTVKRKLVENENENEKPKRKMKQMKKQASDFSKLKLAKSISSMKKPAVAISYESKDSIDSKHKSDEEESDEQESDEQESDKRKTDNDENSIVDDEDNTKVNDSQDEDPTKINDDEDKDEHVSHEKRILNDNTNKNKNFLSDTNSDHEASIPKVDDEEKNLKEFTDLKIKYNTLQKDNGKQRKSLEQKIIQLERKLKNALDDNVKMNAVVSSSSKDWNLVSAIAKRNCTSFQEIATDDPSLIPDLFNNEDYKQEFYKENAKNLPAKSKLNKSSETKVLKENNQQVHTLSDTVEKCEENEDTKKDEKPFVITKESTKSCRTDCISHYVCDLMSVVFTVKEMATSSKNGKQSNANASKNYPVKPAIDKRRLDAVKRLAFKKFGRNPEMKRLTNIAIGSKLQDCSKSYKKDPEMYDDEEDEKNVN